MNYELSLAIGYKEGRTCGAQNTPKRDRLSHTYFSCAF